MDSLPSSGGGKAGALEKLLRYLPIIAIGVGVFYFWGLIVPFVQATLQSTLLTVVYGAILAVTLGPIIMYPKVFWMGYKSLIKKITGLMIKIDPLSYMDRYADYLSEKLDNLTRTKIELQGRQVAAERRIEQLNRDIEQHSKKGAAAIQMKQMDVASLEGSRLEGAKQSLKLYTPNYERMTRSLEFLNELASNWGVSITQLREDIQRKREEYEVIKADAKALGQAEEFLKGDTDASRIYQESLKALEYNVTQKIAYIDDFEKRAEPILKGIQVDNKMQHDSGIAALEAYMKDSNLKLPESFTNGVPTFRSAQVQDVSYEEVGKEKKSFNLLD